MTLERNLLPTDAYVITFGHTKELRTLETYAVNVTLPSITLSEVSTPHRNHQGFVPGDTVQYDSLAIRFLCDEKMELYEDIHNWIMKNRSSIGPVADISLGILNSHNNDNRRVQFINAFPTSLGSIEFNAQATEVTYALLDVNFRYDKFYFDSGSGADFAELGLCNT